jgi:hypothetical protein
MELQLSLPGLRAVAAKPGFGAVARIADRLTSTASCGLLLVVGTEKYEPWHLVAHLHSPLANSVAGLPTLVRYRVPARAPNHLSIGLDQIARSNRADAVLVVASDPASDALLERLNDARGHGATVLSLAGQPAAETDGPHAELESLCHDSARVASGQLEYAQHLLPAITGLPSLSRRYVRRLAGRAS